MFRRSLIVAGVLAGFAVPLAGSALAATVKFHATLTAAAEVPPTKSTGSGEATVSLDTATHEITWDVTFGGFSSDVTAAHIHGPGEPGKNAGRDRALRFGTEKPAAWVGEADAGAGAGADGGTVLRQRAQQELPQRRGARAIDAGEVAGTGPRSAATMTIGLWLTVW